MPRLARLIVTAIVLLVIFVAAAPATAAELTVGDLYNMCTGPGDVNATGCRFYILGAVEGVGTGARPAAAHGWPCFPDGMSGIAMVTFMKLRMGEDLALFPKDKMLPAISFVIAAFAKQYPCR